MAEYIWNGVGLTVPDAWEPVTLERDGLLLGDGLRPVCELKWRTVLGSFSFDKHLKRLAREHRDADVRAVPDDAPPAAWVEAVAGLVRSGLRAQSFIWRAGPHRGIGAALHNPATGLAALVQFFMEDRDRDNDGAPGSENREAEDRAAHILATFRDHSGPDAERRDPATRRTTPFAMFGLRGRVPVSFVLDTFSFRPGHYSVRYWRPRRLGQAARDRRITSGMGAGKGPGTRLTFERFAPASVLLKDRTLVAWAATALADKPVAALPAMESDAGGAAMASWSGPVRTSLARRLLRRETHARGQVWIPPGTNHILVVTATGTDPLPDTTFAAMVESYELV
ncbi:MAG: hypothetical protein KUA35_00080 [Pseudodesulfovibrio sp.]|uniref:Uncharacterized protein n=1 Tax=Pseudodesulfovibrio aespoeensis (strain ATCC 700646 / DSM 10631 / Aspo-2) TaxID=643562 RepID=E6VVU7_PSEA9|nr:MULTISPECIES: hypothetical protein [Pseudodesulfovibrio]MBU4192942.1 hypothetical protein [Pseudomonadota bacterium]ADU61299.1 hypothetical protein Daes_0272 [Pseudodesulfovibrio aespoeensis Aspo-2]MBU4243919.1 hypothetical protein [Pseudomonadota bacterium]MBU4379344.1 hypothetical protein [Pseudomonadota bacterium]MBU4474524.1 hypothetical protein [Pseudomonadota bacterium]